jgi:hypothetical protein
MSADLGTKPAAGTATVHVHPPWRNALELGPVLTGAVFGTGALVAMAHLHVLLVVVVAAALAGGLTAAAVILARTDAGAVWGAASACCAAGWLAYAALAGPWSWPAVAGLVVPALIAVPLWPALSAHEARLADAERRRQAAALAAKGARRWPAYLEKIGFKGVAFVEETETRAGYDVRLRLPDSGRVTFKALASAAEKLEIAARVRRGSLRWEQLPGDQAHMVVLHVSERDFLAEEIRMPIPTRRRSIKDPIPIGVYEDGTVATITLREVATLIVGLRGRGKSNLLNVIIAHLAMCVDVMVFCIDYKHRLARPWLQLWLDGQAYRPVIDWLATTPEETELMLDACLRGIDARKSTGDGREKIEPSVKEPAVLVLCDEMALVLGQNIGGNNYGEGPTNVQLGRKSKRLTVIGRSEAIDPLYATQRGTVTMTGDGDLKSQCDLRIGLGVATADDARLIIPDDVVVAADLARLTEPGSGIIWRKNGRVAPIKIYRCLPEDIEEVCRRAVANRPAPDPLLEAALGDAYRERWTHRGAYLLPGGGKPAAAVVAPPGVDADEFRRIVDTSLSDIDVPVDELAGVEDDSASPARKRYRQYAKRMGAAGVSVSGIVTLLESEKMPTSRQTVHRWLRQDEAAGLVVQTGKFGGWRWVGQ